MGSIRVSGLGKAYKRYGNRWARLLEWLDPDGRRRHEQRWVLRGVDFTVASGESLAIIGHNGAGKSTLLKMITGTTQPTEGSVAVQGRVAALLELGMGFHPEFTGRQNVYTAGQILGLSTTQITELLPEIEAFAEIGDYIDQPVRTYSSGMQVRLAFSVATCVRPDILIVDEALSVGDAYFQHKSFDRIRRFRDDGTTLLFVSHSPGTIKTLCNRALLLDSGGVIRDGAPDVVLDYYNAIIAKREADLAIRQEESEHGRTLTRSGGREAAIVAIDLIDPRGAPARAVVSGEAARIVVEIEIHGDVPDLTAGLLIRDTLGNDVFGTNSFHHGRGITAPQPGARYRASFDFPAFALGQGSYSVSVALHARDAHTSGNYDWWDHALVFQVVRGERPFSIGVCDLAVTVDVSAAPLPVPAAPEHAGAQHATR